MPRERGRKCGHDGERGGSAWAIRARRRQAMGVWHALGARAAAIRGDGLRPERGAGMRELTEETLSAEAYIEISIQS